MEAFEKWWYKNGFNHGIPQNSDETKEAKKVWRAALEIVNSKLWLASGQVADEVKDWIKKELDS